MGTEVRDGEEIAVHRSGADRRCADRFLDELPLAADVAVGGLMIGDYGEGDNSQNVCT